MTVASVSLPDLLDRISDISGLPAVTQRVVAVINDPASSAGTLEHAINYDPTLVARIMRVANSAYYARESRVASIHSAVVLLGFDVIRTVVLAASVADLFREKLTLVGYSRAGLWEHLVSVGAVSRMVTRRIGAGDPEESFVAGMMHDVGVILLDQYAHPWFVRAVEAAQQRGIALHEAEAELLGFDHALVGGQLAEAWNFAAPICSTIAHHHAPQSAVGDGRALAMIVHLSDVLAQARGAPLAGDPARPVLHRSAMSELGLRPTDIRVFNTDIEQELQAIREFYELVR